MYFSNLSLEKRWYIRQFINSSFVKGFNKNPLENIALQRNELFGFNNNGETGTGKLTMNLSTVIYAPYNFIGFKFAPVLLIGLGMLETQQNKLFNSKIYQAYALGLLIRNESFLNSSFEISFGMYPNLPGMTKPVYRFNPVTTFTFRAMSFDLKKPAMVTFE